MDDCSKQTESRITVLEVQYGNMKDSMGRIETSIETIQNNHLPHIHGRIDAMKSWLIGVMVTLCINLIGVITLILRS